MFNCPVKHLLHILLMDNALGVGPLESGVKGFQ